MSQTSHWHRVILILLAFILLSTPIATSASATTRSVVAGTSDISGDITESALEGSSSTLSSPPLQRSEAITDTASPAVDPGQLPLTFIPNMGQSEEAVQYQVEGLGASILFEAEQVVLALPDRPDTEGTDGVPDPTAGAAAPEPTDMMMEDSTASQLAELTSDTDASAVIVHLSLDGANPPSEVTPVDPLPGVVNYYLSEDSADWYEAVPTYAGLVYHEVYPGIDVHYDGTQGSLKSNYLVAPGADPSVIRWRYEGSTSLSVDEAGRLHVTLPVSESGESQVGDAIPAPELIEDTPLAWQDIDGQQVPVSLAYNISEDGSIGFTVGAYDPAFGLTLDPTLNYYSYWGGSAGDYAYDNVVDSAGNVHITGTTSSSTFRTANAHQSTYGGGSYDAFVMKLNPSGGLVFSTYLGGTSWDSGEDVSLDTAGYVYVSGFTNSSDFPLLKPLLGQETPRGGYDAFVTTLTSRGLLYFSTRLGGDGDDYAYGVAASGSAVYVTGSTASTNFPMISAISGARGGTDLFVAKMAPRSDGFWTLRYSTYLGGSGNETHGKIIVDGSGQAYVMGTTASTNFYPAPTGLQTTNRGLRDVYVAKLNSTGTGLIYSTYLGGTGEDYNRGLVLDISGNLFLIGQTFSSNFPLVNPGQALLNGNGSTAYSDAFVTKLNPTGTQLLFSTYLGGELSDSGQSLALGSSGPLHLTGYTASTEFPTYSAWQYENAGGNDIFVSTMNRATGALTFSTYLGGSGNDLGRGISVDGKNRMYIVGYSWSPNLNTTNALQASLSGSGSSSDVLIAASDPLPTPILSYFYRHTSSLTATAEQQIAEYSGLLILNKREDDRRLMDRLRGHSENPYDSLALLYVQATELQEWEGSFYPGTTTPRTTPDGNQWGYRLGDWNALRGDPKAFLWRCTLEGDATCASGRFRLIGPDEDAFYIMDPSYLRWREFIAGLSGVLPSQQESLVQTFINDTDGRGINDQNTSTTADDTAWNHKFDGLFLDNVHLTLDAVCHRAYRELQQTTTTMAPTAIAGIQCDGSTGGATPIFRCANFASGFTIASRSAEGTNCTAVNKTTYAADVRGLVALVRRELDELEPQRAGVNIPLWGNMLDSPYPTGSNWNSFMTSPVSMDGGMFESWTTGFSGAPINKMYQKAILSQAQWLTANGKSFLAYGIGTQSLDPHAFALASYLLVVPPRPARPSGTQVDQDPLNNRNVPRAVFQYADGPNKWWWFEEYRTTKLGNPLYPYANYPDPSSSLYRLIWRRCFENGVVFVDPDYRTGWIDYDSTCEPPPTGGS